jgi:hypothetical protein
MATLTITTSAIATSDDAMNFITLVDTDNASYVDGNALLYSDEDVIEAFLEDEAITAAQTTAMEYTDGYVAGFKYELGTDMVGEALASGSDDFSITHGACFTGSSGIGEAETMATSCAGYTFTWTNCDTTPCALDMTKVQLYAEDLTRTIDTTDTWSAIVDDTDVVGLNKSWQCTAAGPILPAETITEVVTVTCARFLPAPLDEVDLENDDLRFDGGDALFDGSVMVMLDDDIAEGDGTYEWSSAFEAATVAGALALAALTF